MVAISSILQWLGYFYTYMTVDNLGELFVAVLPSIVQPYPCILLLILLIIIIITKMPQKNHKMAKYKINTVFKLYAYITF